MAHTAHGQQTKLVALRLLQIRAQQRKSKGARIVSLRLVRGCMEDSLASYTCLDIGCVQSSMEAGDRAARVPQGRQLEQEERQVSSFCAHGKVARNMCISVCKQKNSVSGRKPSVWLASQRRERSYTQRDRAVVVQAPYSLCNIPIRKLLPCKPCLPLEQEKQPLIE